MRGGVEARESWTNVYISKNREFCMEILVYALFIWVLALFFLIFIFTPRTSTNNNT